jgi:hypothetical protein
MKVKSKIPVVLSLPNEMIFAADGSVTGGITSRTVASSVPLDGGAFSFSGWVKCSNPNLRYNRIFALGTAFENDKVMLRFLNTSGMMSYVVLHNSTHTGTITATSVFPSNQWVLVQLIHRADRTAELYWDGVSKAAGLISLPLVGSR